MEKTSGLTEKNPRLDRTLKERYPQLSSRQIKEAIEHGLVLADESGRLKKGGRYGDLKIDTSKLDLQIKKLRGGNSALSGPIVLYETPEFIIVDKPVGMPSHPLGLFDEETITNWCLARYSKARNEFKDQVQPTVCPHRLDTDTSGLLIVCLSGESFQSWRKMFESKQIEKSYLAWCWGVPSSLQWEMNQSIAHHPSDKARMTCVAEGKNYRPPLLEAKTFFKVRKQSGDKVLIEAAMKTGVTHQIRVHAAASGFPLVGDSKYDLGFKSRKQVQVTHLLRAFKIKTETDNTFIASTEAFENLF